MTVVRITIKKTLNQDLYSPQQTAQSAFSSDYFVQTDASFPSAQLEAYALNIAQAESRLYPNCVRFYEAMVKLATPGASGEELRGKFSSVDLNKIRGQVEMGEDDVLAFPPIAAVFARNAQWGNGGRLVLSRILTAREWNLYHSKYVVPSRFQSQNAHSLTPSSLFSHELIEAVRGSNGTYVRPSAAGERQQGLPRINDFVFQVFQVSSLRKSKRKKAAPRRSLLGNSELETDASALNKNKKTKVPVAGVVYLLKAGPHFKIGKSIVFEKRLRQIKLQLPERAEEIHVIQSANPSEVESYWHRRFAPLRLNGEWFRLTEAEVNEFKSVSQM